MKIHNVISYVHNFDQSGKFQVVFEAHGSSFLVIGVVDKTKHTTNRHILIKEINPIMFFCQKVNKLNNFIFLTYLILLYLPVSLNIPFSYKYTS